MNQARRTRLRPRSPVLDVVLTVVKSDDLDHSRIVLEAVPDELVDPLIAAAREHGVEAWLAACAPPGDLRYAELAAQRPRFLAARARQRAVANAVTDALADQSLQCVVLKGMAISSTVYPRPDLRHSVDLDLLVRPEDFARVIATLAAEGYELLDTNWPLIAELVPGELRVRAPNSTMIDLHWHLLQEPSLRREFNLPTGELLGRAVVLDQGPLLTLHPVDQLLHTALHATRAGANRLIWMIDLDRLVRRRDYYWPDVVAAASRSRTGLPVALALARTRSTLGTPIPGATLSALAGSHFWLGASRVVDVASPLRLDPSRPALSIAFARSTHARAGRSAVEFVRHGLAWIRSGAPRSRPEVDWLDPDSESSALHAVPDDIEQSRYFATIISGG